MKKSILLFALALSASLHAQEFFQHDHSKMLFFTSSNEAVEYIVICERESLKTIGGMRNVPFSNPHTFFSPGEFVATGVSISDEGEITLHTEVLEFDVTDATINLNVIELLCPNPKRRTINLIVPA